MLGTLDFTLLRGHVWAGGAQREGKADYRERVLEGMTCLENRQNVGQLASQPRICLLLILPNKSFSELQNASPFHSLEFSHMELQSFQN